MNGWHHPREAKPMTIGGGAGEIMKDLAARRQGW